MTPINFDFSRITAIERKVDWLEKEAKEQKELLNKLLDDISDFTIIMKNHPLYTNVRRIK